MVRTVAWYLFFGLIAVLVIVWLLGGGIDKVKSATGDFSNPLGFFASGLYGGGAVQLPWAIPIPQGPDISGLTGASGQSNAITNQAQTFGNESQYGSDISLSTEGATASNPQEEYVVIQNTGQSTIDISGWSLQSAQTGARAYIPLGASFFELGQLNAQTGIELNPGGVAVITTGESPVGTSFRENECSGYLEDLQQYTPPLGTQCPFPSNAAAQAAQYGQACADYVSSIPFCTFPQNPPANLSQQCKLFVQTRFSYNGCIAENQSSPTFSSSDWRVYLDVARELWNNSHDTIRLLDSKGEVVAVASY